MAWHLCDAFECLSCSVFQILDWYFWKKQRGLVYIWLPADGYKYKFQYTIKIEVEQKKTTTAIVNIIENLEIGKVLYAIHILSFRVWKCCRDLTVVSVESWIHASFSWQFSFTSRICRTAYVFLRFEDTSWSWYKFGGIWWDRNGALLTVNFEYRKLCLKRAYKN